MASALFVSDFASVSGDKAPFIWARAVALLGADGQPDPGKRAPNTANSVSSARYAARCRSPASCEISTTQGLRYLHCNLCETEWHVVRVKCSNCEQSRDLHYWSLDSEQAAVKAEAVATAEPT